MADPLDLPLRELLKRLLAGTTTADPDPWLDVPDEWRRRVVAAAERAELAASRVGRRVIWRRSTRDAWLEAHAIAAAAPAATTTPSTSPVAHLLQQHGYRRSGEA